ncbi:hypothetical protein [Endozoicomonas acroporae]|uniref:hypothetical protein n=1 Tax=Endozoicomonas acroporae TaxID=1701104 RepID=UPI0013D2912E|nr:hypothetical protein [Endozoicomonas acroporae]
MTRVSRNQSFKKRMLKKCHYMDCQGGSVVGMMGSLSDCATCNGLGLVDADTGEALPERDVIRQLLMRFEEQRLRIHQMKQYQEELQRRLEGYERGR